MDNSSLESKLGSKSGSEAKRMDDSSSKSESSEWMILFYIWTLLRIENPGMPPKTFGIEGTFSKGSQFLILYSVRFDGSHDRISCNAINFYLCWI